MITFNEDEIIIIPLAYNLFVKSLNNKSNVCRFVKENILQECDINELIKCINNLPKDKFVAIDMVCISFCNSRIFKDFKTINNLYNVFFYNINKSTNVRDRIAEDTGCSFNYDLETNKDKLCFSSLTYNMITESQYEDKLERLMLNTVSEIVKKVTETKIQFLESSGIWSNKYVDLKKLFSNSDEYTYIIYKMAETTQKYYNNADALISTSKTGSVFANLIGQLLNKKVVHYVGVGPKFALSVDEVKNSIRKGKKYIYICDFICLGTELKILNALIKSGNADLLGGVGVASYINTSDIRLNDSIVGKVKCLVNVIDFGMNYKIGISKEELMEEEKHERK